MRGSIRNVCTGGLFGASRLTAPRTPAEPRGKAARFLALGLAAAAAAGAEAQTPAQPSGPAADYPGVVPGAGHPPPAARQAAGGARNVLTWPGLEVTAAGSRIFVQSTAAPSWSRSDADNRIVIRIRNARIHLSNNLNPLVATHFDTTPVASARLVRRGRDVELVVELKARAAASVRVEAGADRYHYLFVEFPPGTYLVPASDLPAGETTDRPTVDIGGDAGIRRGRTRAAPAEGGAGAAPPAAQ